MQSWYTSQARFNAKIIKLWEKRGFRYNQGHVQLLRFAYRCLMYHSSLKSEKVSRANKVDCYPGLF